MAESREQLEQKIRALESRLQSGAGDILAEVQLGGLKKQLQQNYGVEAPIIVPEPTRSDPKSVHIENVNIHGDGHTIATGGGMAIGQVLEGASSEERIRMFAEAYARTGGNAQLIGSANALGEVFPESTQLEAATARAPQILAAHGTPYPARVCRLKVSKDGKSVSSGTGSLIAPNLILTCRHVVPDVLTGVRVHFRFVGPVFEGLPGIDGDVRYAHSLEVEAMIHRSRNTLDLWDESPEFVTADDVRAGKKDFILLQTDPDTERWGVEVSADRRVLPLVNAGHVLAQIVPPSDPFGPCLSSANNPTANANIEFLRLGDSGQEQREPGSLGFADPWHHHSIPDTERGDSGAPFIVPGCGFVGMHTSRGDVPGVGPNVGRLVHVERLRDHLDQNSDLKTSQYGDALRALNWIS